MDTTETRGHVDVVDRILRTYAPEVKRKHGNAVIVSAENKIHEMLQRSVLNLN